MRLCLPREQHTNFHSSPIFSCDVVQLCFWSARVVFAHSKWVMVRIVRNSMNWVARNAIHRYTGVCERFIGVNERLISVNERLISMNERVISVNERLISVNERLISVNERVISVNERLISVNERLLGDSAGRGKRLLFGVLFPCLA